MKKLYKTECLHKFVIIHTRSFKEHPCHIKPPVLNAINKL